jgi:restriction system protein
MLNPILKVLAAAGEDLPRARLLDELAIELGITTEEREERLPSGTQAIFDHRVEWARCQLQMEGLIEGSMDLGLRLSQRGWDNVRSLFPELACGTGRRTANRSCVDGPGSEAEFETATRLLGLTPSNDLERYDVRDALARLRRLQQDLAGALVDRVARQSPEFFERVILDLLVAMGYARGRPELTRHLGRTGDGGVDGVVALDELGLEVIYFQAKRFRPDIPVPVAAVRDFVGALDGKRADRGVFFTTSIFPPSAWEFARQSSFRVVLIDGIRLGLLMVRHDIGVRTKEAIEIKRIDESYFAA